MKMPKKLSRTQVIKRLNDLAEAWPDDLMLFAYNGLLIVDPRNGEVLDDVSIPCDGGDPGFCYQGDKEFVQRFYEDWRKKNE